MAWSESIQHRRAWSRQADEWRFREAFTAIAATFTQWPTPSQFLEALPPRRDQPAPKLVLIENDQQKADRARREADSEARIKAIIEATADKLRIYDGK